ncbi:MAG: hypothetical protein IT337_10580 [Thermomicrobiales bacterium]|nr:hypothetical protein [Thermomicrobiales bacterium]
MPTPDPLADRLLDLLRLVNDWLKFAETKNVGIVGLASGGLTLLVAATGFLRAEGIPLAAGFVLTAAGALLALSLLVGVWSFMPASGAPQWLRSRIGAPNPSDNLLYFGHAAKYSPHDLVETIARRYERQSDPVIHALHTDLAAQLVINARITLQKLWLFRWAVILFAAGVLMAAAGMLVAILR